jgi:hypothetical protein
VLIFFLRGLWEQSSTCLSYLGNMADVDRPFAVEFDSASQLAVLRPAAGFEFQFESATRLQIVFRCAWMLTTVGPACPPVCLPLLPKRN